MKPPNPSPEAEEVKGPGIGEERNHLEENQEGESQTEDNPVMNFFKTLVSKTFLWILFVLFKELL